MRTKVTTISSFKVRLMEQRSILNTDLIFQGPIVSDLRSSAATVKAGKSTKVANADAAKAQPRPLPECVVLANMLAWGLLRE